MQVQGYILGTLMRGHRMLSVYSLLRQDTNKFTSDVAFSQAPLSALLYEGQRYVCLSSFTMQSCNCLVADQTDADFPFFTHVLHLFCSCFSLSSSSLYKGLFAPSSVFTSLMFLLHSFFQHLFFSSNCIPSFIKSHEMIIKSHAWWLNSSPLSLLFHLRSLKLACCSQVSAGIR